ncbi:transposase-like protein [Methylobacterium brachiatum]|uniref:Transposase-like protein n=1 Tax=Methylobacterium brachiatum TaxID=269660 RepID=A0AAJ1TZS5_9HYPH|nr:transposase-like protein [Methylobacterium brachiatum]
MSSDPPAPPVHGEILTGVQRRRRWSTTEKIRLVEESQQPGSSVSFVARRYGISPSLLFSWKRRMLEGGHKAVHADEEVVGTSRVRELERRVRDLERLLGRKTMEVEILKEALDPARTKKLGRQSWLLGLLFRGGEVGVGIAAEAGACGASLSSAVEGSAQCPPRQRIDPAEVASGWCLGPRADAGDEPYSPPHHGAGRSRLASGGTPFVVALRTEQLLQSIIGTRQVGPVGGVEQPGPVAARHLAEVVEGDPAIADTVAVTPHRCQETIEAAPDLGSRLLGRIGQEARGSVPEDEALLHRRPERRRAGERSLDQERERARCPPLNPPAPSSRPPSPNGLSTVGRPRRAEHGRRR